MLSRFALPHSLPESPTGPKGPKHKVLNDLKALPHSLGTCAIVPSAHLLDPVDQERERDGGLTVVGPLEGSI